MPTLIVSNQSLSVPLFPSPCFSRLLVLFFLSIPLSHSIPPLPIFLFQHLVSYPPVLILPLTIPLSVPLFPPLCLSWLPTLFFLSFPIRHSPSLLPLSLSFGISPHILPCVFCSSKLTPTHLTSLRTLLHLFNHCTSSSRNRNSPSLTHRTYRSLLSRLPPFLSTHRSNNGSATHSLFLLSYSIYHCFLTPFP